MVYFMTEKAYRKQLEMATYIAYQKLEKGMGSRRVPISEVFSFENDLKLKYPFVEDTLLAEEISTKMTKEVEDFVGRTLQRYHDSRKKNPKTSEKMEEVPVVAPWDEVSEEKCKRKPEEPNPYEERYPGNIDLATCWTDALCYTDALGYRRLL